jgi:hypothetical protein
MALAYYIILHFQYKTTPPQDAAEKTARAKAVIHLHNLIVQAKEIEELLSQEVRHKTLLESFLTLVLSTCGLFSFFSICFFFLRLDFLFIFTSIQLNVTFGGICIIPPLKPNTFYSIF